jgi:MFS family permease
MSGEEQRRGRLAEFLGLRRSVMGLLGMVVLVGMGEHMAERFLPLYLQQLTRGATTVLAIGLLAGMDDLLSALYSFPGGYLSSRLGTKRALLLFNLLSMAGYLVVILVPTWWAVLLGAAFFISWSAISLPATMALVARAVPRNRRTMGVSVQSLVRRIPKTLGPVVGGAFIAGWGVSRGVRLAFVAALVMAGLAIVLQQTLIEDDRHAAKGAEAEKNPLRMFRRMSPALRNLLASDILIRFCERIPDAFVVVWCTRWVVSPISEFQFGILSAVENITAVLCYIPVARMADRLGKKPFVAITFGFFTLFPLVLLFSRSLWPLMLAFVVRGLKEFGEPTRKALIMDLAPEDAKDAMFGLYYLIRDVIVAFAAFGGALLWGIRPELSLCVAFVFGIIGTTWFIVRGQSVTAPECRA